MDKKKSGSFSQDDEQRRHSDLDETMEEIFHPSTDRFSLADLQSRDNLDIRPKCDERDFERHRRESLHHHHPLHRLHHRHRRSSHRPSETHIADTSKATQEIQTEPEPVTSNVADGTVSKEVQVTEEALAESELETPEASQAPLLSKSKETGKKEAKKGAEEGKVQFYVGSASSIEDNANVPSSSGSLADRLSSFFKSPKTPLKSALKHPETISESSPKRGLSQSATQPSTSEGAPKAETLETSFTDVALGRPPTGQSFVSDAVQGKPKVTFQLGEEVTEEEPEAPSTSKKHTSKHGKKHHKSRDTLSHRMHVGSDLGVKSYHDVLEPEEAKTLQTADIEDMASHRFEDPKAIRRHKIRAKSKSSADSFKYSGKDEGSEKHGSPFAKKVFDHQPHEIFVELHELFPEAPLAEEYRVSLEPTEIPSGEFLWRQTARWIKYEEDVEERADRWGKPHVASLSFHSLINLRKCLETSVVLLDVEEAELPAIANRIVDAMATADQIKPEHKVLVLKALLSRKRHVNEKMSAPFLRRNSSGYGNLNMLSHERNKSPRFLRMMRNITDHDFYHNCTSQDRTTTHPETNVLMPEVDGMKDVTIVPSSRRGSSVEDHFKYDTGIMRRVPANSEATAVLVGSLLFLEEPAVAFVRLAQGHIIANLLEIPIPLRFLFVLLGPLNSDLDYHEIGRSISTLMSNKNFHQVAYKADGRTDLLRAINEFLDDSVVLPPGDWEKKSFVPMDEIKRRSIQFRKRETLVVPEEEEEEPDIAKELKFDPLKRTGRCFGGFLNDVKNRYPWYKSDLLDGLDKKCIGATLSIYFAALSGAVTFGGLLGAKTDRKVGVTETLLVTSICGVVFSLLACQPLIIVGTTGPMLLFDEILYQYCISNGVDFLRLRVWTSFWTALIATVVVAFEGSSLLRYITRFMQEIYATIISLLFIAESFTNLYKIFVENPVQEIYCDDNQGNTTTYTSPGSKLTKRPNTALLSLILMFGTFLIALFLRHVRNSKFFGRRIAKQLGDFGVPIAILVMLLSDFAFKDVSTQKLELPEGLKPSTSDRGWFISPLPITVEEAFGTIATGFLIFILMFLETQICELILSKKERKMKKGSGFHFDMLLISYMEVLCALLGGPWLCATTVRSLSHVAGLTEMSTTHAPGESPYIVEVKEQRISNLIISLGVGMSILLAPYLSLIPVAVLFGVFLYMGITSLSGIQLCERFLLLFMPNKHHPDVPYVRKVLTKKMHLFTVIQLTCIAVLWGVKSSILAPGFPFGLLSLIIVRSQLKCCFSDYELKALDGEDDEGKKEDEPDFNEQMVA